jgi:glycosyltransferase involved in cell wall biosynthesis
MTPGSDIALVHDDLHVLRGAERTFAAMADCWPEAPIYTLLYDADGTKRRFDSHPVQGSYLQRLPVRQAGFRRMMPLFPNAVESLPLTPYDTVVSSSSAFAHGVRTKPDAVHVCYCHSPFRYAWFEQARALSELPAPLRPVGRRMLGRIRRWDADVAQSVTHYIANSEITRERMQRYWSRDAPVVHPPVDVDRFNIGEPEDWFLVVTELVRHKRVDVALEAARLAGKPVKVVGHGPDRERLEQLHGDHTDFVGRVDDRELADLYSRTQALIMPNVEEFGIAGVEAQAAGRPVVAAAAGGACETVVDGETGVLVPPGDVHALAEALSHTDFDRFRAEDIADHAEQFSTETFQQRLRDEVAQLVAVAVR